MPSQKLGIRHTDLAVQLGVYSFFGRVAVRTLMWLMVFQPVYVALGMELETPAEEAVVTEQTEPVVDEGMSQEETTTQEEAEDESTEEVSSNDVPAEEETTPDTDDSGLMSENETDEQDADTTSEEGDISETDTDGVENVTGGEEGGGTSGSGSDAVENNEKDETTPDSAVLGDTDSTGSSTASSTDEEIATTTDEVLPDEGTEGVTGIPQNSENAFIFSDGDCTLVAEGEFYCVKNETPRIQAGDPRVYAEKDREGDREIYYFDGVEVHRITNNSYDDFAPVFDERTLRIVWQAMLNDRLQVMLHEITTNTTRQITSSRQNSSNPDIEGDIVVWQEWVDTNWEIMMTDVDVQGGEFEIEQLTDNTVHDMFPRAYEDLITWQSERGTSWEVIVYDLRTGKQTALEKNEGTKYENPRFVLLFDSKHENGDVETIGYDLDTGEMMELGTKANPQPQAPASPKDEAPDALPREATTTPKVKEGGEDDGPDDDFLL